MCRATGGSQRVATVEGWRGSVARPPAGQHGARRDGSQARLLRGEISFCGGAGGLRGLRPVNTEHVIVFQGWRATSGRVRRAISLRNAPTGNPAHPHQTHGGNVAGIFGRGRRPRRPAPGAGTAATRAARPHDAARFHFGTRPHRRARVPAPRHEAPRRRKMRFHRVIILKAVAPRGVIRSAIAALPGSVSAARARREADTFPVLAHRVPVKIDIPVRNADGGQHGPPPRKNG